MRIGELARRTGTAVETIRYYEKQGLLPLPPRTEGNYRSYQAEHEGRLHFIRQCRALDMSLDEVRALLALRDRPEQGCDAVNQVIDEHIRHVEDRVRELSQLAAQLRQLRARCSVVDRAEDCGILQELSQASAEVTVAGQHVPGSHSVHGR
ncbi:Cd(II)/Pb(II)-responsive transcriptional regulator [Isoalcanivorax beigongshangi]|uniref:Cd(II)/Pb(II)-responsive transcriptional regulator n=1 Tax=Isoalcanivorax beigongshangi TaxID=3238810 RepID=A0ABV4AH73_9GAMM